MKKIISNLLAIMFMFNFVACSQNETIDKQLDRPKHSTENYERFEGHSIGNKIKDNILKLNTDDSTNIHHSKGQKIKDIDLMPNN